MSETACAKFVLHISTSFEQNSARPRRQLARLLDAAKVQRRSGLGLKFAHFFFLHAQVKSLYSNTFSQTFLQLWDLERMSVFLIYLNNFELQKKKHKKTNKGTERTCGTSSMQLLSETFSRILLFYYPFFSLTCKEDENLLGTEIII